MSLNFAKSHAECIEVREESPSLAGCKVALRVRSLEDANPYSWWFLQG